jgi:tetratricopeptide (TPR) repeat protein
MKNHSRILFPFAFCLLLFVLSFNSCKQCNSTQIETVKTDSLSIPKLDMVNGEIRKDSLNPFLYYKRAQLHEANNDFKSAATDMFLALSLDSLQAEFYLYAAELFKLSGEPQRGIALVNKALLTDSMNISFYVKAAELAYIDTTVKGNYHLALSYLNTAIEKDPQNAEIYFYKGTIFKETGDTTKALSSFQTAIELNPKYYDAYVQLGLLLNERNDKNAEKYLDNAIKVGAQPGDALYAKANMLKEAAVELQDKNKYDAADEKFNRAIETFKKVIELSYRNVEAYMGTGFCYYQMDSVEEAYTYYQLASKIEPRYAGAYFSMGMCAEDLGRKQEAISLYQNCLNIDPDFSRAKDHLDKLLK